MGGLKTRVKTIPELVEISMIYARRAPLEFDEKAVALLTPTTLEHLEALADDLNRLPAWSESGIEATVRAYAERHALKLGALAQPLRAALTGSTVSPSIFEVVAVFGRNDVMYRLKSARQAVRAT
jgi:glutamyl-tRNA synthetase